MRNNQIFPRRVEAWKISKFTDFSFPFQYFIYRDTNMRATGSPNARSFRIVIASMDANDNVCSVPNATTYRRYAEFSPAGMEFSRFELLPKGVARGKDVMIEDTRFVLI